jgi:anti-sigma factor RsiW
MSRIEGLHDRADARHLFGCPDCRADARVAHAWRALVASEADAPVRDEFVARVLETLRRDRDRAGRWRLGLAAAAALLFFFFAGLSHEQATGTSEPSVEESLSSLSAPPAAVDGLLPE